MTDVLDIGLTLIPWEPSDAGGGPLGRHREHDPRSRAYAAAEPADVSTLTSRVHEVHCDVLDQGDTGSCVGNSALYEAATGPLYDALTAMGSLPPFNENEARDVVYHLATQLDSVGGTYPPDDTGSTGIGGAKALVKLGLARGYQHAFSLNAALAYLSRTGPGCTGVNWYDSMDRPDAHGVVSISRNAGVRGGHEIVVVGVNVVEPRLVMLRNSWGPKWGVEVDGKPGYFYMSWDTWDRLLHEQGDFTMATPDRVPPTPPSPTPTPTPGRRKASDLERAARTATEAYWAEVDWTAA